MELCFLHLWQHRIEHRSQVFVCRLVSFVHRFVLLGDEAFGSITIHAHKASLFPLLFELTHQRSIELSIEQERIVALRLCSFDVRELRLAVVGVETHQLLILVGLVLLDGFAIFLVGISLTVNVFEKSEVFRLIVEIGFRENAVVDEEFEVVPLFFKLSAVALEERRKAVGHLLGDVLRNLLHIAVALEIRTAHVERNVWTVDNPMQERQEVGYNVFHRVCDKHLVAIELNLIAMDFDVVFNLWEIQNTREIERIVHIEVNPEEGFILHGIEIAIEIAIILISQGRRRLCPKRVSVVDHVVLSSVHLLAIFPLLLLAKGNGDGEEAAVFVEQGLDATLFEEFLVFLVNVQHDVCASFRLFGWFECEFGSTIATPFHSFRTFAVALGHDVYTT